jgi:hypothetical protein
MSSSAVCPKCRTPLSANDRRPGERTRCPSCGANIRLEADDGKSQHGLKKKKKKKAKPVGMHRGLVIGIIAGGAFLVFLSAGLIFVFARGRGKENLLGSLSFGTNDFTVVVDSVPPAAALPPLPDNQKFSAVLAAPAPPRSGRLDPPKATREWVAAPDPSTEPAWEVPDKWGLPAYGVPIVASHNGPFAYVVPHAVFNGSPSISAIDLRTGKPAPGGFAQKAGIGHGGLLSPDGRFFVTDDTLRDPNITPKEGPPLLVWQNDGKDPAIRLAMRGILLWHDFIATDKLAAALYEWGVPEGPPETKSPKISYQVWEVATGKNVVRTTLGAEDVAVVPIPLAKEADQDKEMLRAQPPFYPTRLLNDSRPVQGAISPGGKYVVLGGRNHVTILEATTGKIAGELPLAVPLGRRCYQGFGFSPDGDKLYGLIDFLPAPAPGATAYRHNVRLVTWSMTDGAECANAPLGDLALCGPIVSGPDSKMLIVPIRAKDALGLTQFGLLGTSVEIVSPAQVVMTETGAPFLPLKDMRPLRWLKSGRLLAAGPMNLAPHVPADKSFTHGMFVLPFGIEDVRAKAKEDFDAVGARPPVVAADRSGITTAAPGPPGQWAVPKAPSPSPVGAEFPVWPAAFSDSQAAVIRFGSESKPIYRLPVSWERYDLASGKLLGTVKLWPWSASFDSEAHAYWTRYSEVGLSAALTADGKRLALRDPVDPTRVDVWEEDGRRLVGIRPYDAKPIEWLGFAAGGNLLTLGNGKLTSWKIPEAKATYEVDGGYTGLRQFAPGRGWLAATAGSKVDFLDSATGKCLGRIEDQPYADGPGYTMAISPDGRYLVRVGIGQARTHGGNDMGVFTVARVWDTATGKPLTSIRIAGTSLRGAFWFSPHQFLANDQLVDVSAAAAVCGYHFPNNFPWPEGHERVTVYRGFKDADLTRATPQGRIFVQTKTGWKTNAIPTAGPDSVLSGNPEYAYHPGVPLRIEVKSKVKEAGQKLADSMAEIMRDRGATIGPDGWLLRLTYTIADSKDTSVKFTGVLAGMKMPEMNYTWSLVTPDGATAWSKTNSMRWGYMGSKYSGRTKSVGPSFGPNAPNIRETELDFKGRDPHAAIEEELHEQLAGIGATFPPEVPRAILKSSAGFVPLPLTAEYRAPGK